MTGYTSATALFGNLIDYAGTFPPAALSLETAMAQACAFRRQAKHPWLLSKIVVTIEDLKKLSPRAWFNAGSDGTPLPLTVIGTSPEKPQDLVRHLGFEMREIRRFNERFMESSLRQRVIAYETRLPESVSESEISSLLRNAFDAALVSGILGMEVFVEIPLTGSWQGRLAEATRCLSEWNEEGQATAGVTGMKIRTGGKYLPSAEQLAEVIRVCVTHALRFKATQGLHHAVSREGDYGFANLFAALAFAHSKGIDEFNQTAIINCLKESRPAAFQFSHESLEWEEFQLKTDEIEAARRQHGGTFGSCSLAEPDQFLAEELNLPEEK